jgi:ATP-binding cassette, subfamily B, bacterial
MTELHPALALWQLLVLERGRALRATLWSILNKLFDIAPEILIGIAIDVVVRREESFVAALGIVDPIQQLYALGALTLLIWVGESLFEYLYLLGWRGLAQDVQHALRGRAFEHAQHLPMRFFEDASVGNLVAVINDDVNQLERFLNGGVNALVQVVTSVIAIGLVFFVVSPTLALLAYLPIPLILWGAFFFHGRAEPLYAQVRERAGALAARIDRAITGVATVRAMGTAVREIAALNADSSAYRAANARAIRLSSAFIPLIRMAILSGFLLTFVIGGVMVLDGRLNVGLYGVLVFLTQRLLWPLTQLAETVDLYERAMASVRRVLNLLEQAPEENTGRFAPTSVRGEIEFDDVSFTYRERTIIDALSLQIKPGQTVALVGATGSGKTSLLKLLLRFYVAYRGQVRIDGVPVEQWHLLTLRRTLGLVSQEVLIFPGSIRDNLRYAAPNASAADIERAARAAEAHDFIEQLPNGYDTDVGERGLKLSGGERQRLSLARVLLHDPPILLLDEATSAVDNETEAAIQRSLKTICVGRTTLIVAHRLSTIVHADRIVVLDQGRIIEQGRFDELIRSNGAFANLWRVQTGAA